MTPQPTGRIEKSATGVDLILVRSFAAGIDDVWASLTESDRTALWFGRWEGMPGAGSTVRLQMGFEQESPWSDVRIDACVAPSLLAVSFSPDSGGWAVEVRLRADGDATELTFIQHCKDTEGLGEIGPGWEYYLDNLAASRVGEPLPDFDDYLPAQQAYYAGLVIS